MGSDWKWGRMWRKWVNEGSASGPFSSLTENTAIGSEQSRVMGQESLVCCHPRVCCREACRPGKPMLLGSIWGQHCIGSLCKRWIQDSETLYNVSLMGAVRGLWEGCTGGCMAGGCKVGDCMVGAKRQVMHEGLHGGGLHGRRTHCRGAAWWGLHGGRGLHHRHHTHCIHQES